MNKNSFDLAKWLGNDHLEFLYRHRYPLLNADLFFYTTKKHHGVLGNHHRNFIFTSRQGELATYHFLSELDRGQVFSEALLDRKYRQRHFLRSGQARIDYGKFIDQYRKRSKTLTQLSDRQLLALFKSYWENFSRVFAYFRTSNPKLVDHFVGSITREVGRIIRSKTKEQKLIKYLTTPYKDDPTKKELADWLKILDSPKDDQKLAAHAERYPWLLITTYAEKDALEYLQGRYLRDRKQSAALKRQLATFEREKALATQSRKEVLANNKYLKVLSDLVLEQSHERLLVKCAWTGIDYAVRGLLEEVARRAGLGTADLMGAYRFQDIVRLLEQGVKLSLAERARRLDCFVLLSDDLRDLFITGQEAERLYAKINYHASKKEISGVAACPGQARGIVRIIDVKNAARLNEQVKAFRDGDIIVAGMTEPNLASLMMRAGAIVTDQGGVTSHAAIISREYGKPCIVGTKFATQLLHDGDMVEVDADKGIVRIIN